MKDYKDNIETFTIENTQTINLSNKHLNESESIERLPKNIISKDFTSYDTALFQLPYNRNIYSIKEFKQEVNEMALDLEEGLKINTKNIIKNKKIQNIFLELDDIIIVTQNAEVYELNLSNKQHRQFDIKTKIKTKNIKKSLKIKNIPLIFTIEQNSNYIFIWSIENCSCEQYIDIQLTVNDIVQSEDNVIVCSYYKLFVIRISDLKIRYILDCKDVYLQQLQWDASNNILYTYGKGVLTEWDILNKSKQRNIKITSNKERQKQFILLDENQNVLIYYDQEDILIINLQNFIIKREIRINEKNIQGYILQNEMMFIFYLQSQNKLGMIFNYNKDPFYINNFPKKKQNNNTQLFYTQLYKSDTLIIENDGLIEITMNQNQKPFPLFYSENEFNTISCESDMQIFYWQKIDKDQKVKQKVKVQKHQNDLIEQEKGSNYIDIQMRYKDRSNEQEDGDIMMYDKVIDKKRIVIESIGSRVNDIKLSCKGLYKYDLNQKKLKKFNGVNYNIEVRNIIINQDKNQLLYSTRQQIFLLNNEDNESDPIDLGQVYPKQICLDQQKNRLYCSGDGIYGWCLEKLIQWRITSSKDMYGWDCLTLDCNNQILYSSNTNKVYHWDLQNKKELGLFINIDQYIIQLEQNKYCNYIYIGTKTQIYVVHKNTGNVLDLFNFKTYDFQFLDIKFNFDSSSTYTIMQKEIDDDYNEYCMVHWLSNLCKVTIQESLFLQQFFNHSLTIEQFINNLKIFFNIYKNSVLLREYFNLYFIAAIHNLPDAIDYIYNQYDIQYPYYNKQTTPLKIALLLNHVKTAQRIVYVIDQQSEYMKMDESEIKLLLQSKEVIIHDFLPKLFLPIHTYSNNVPLQKLTMLRTYKIVESQSDKFSPKIYDQIVQYNPTIKDKILQKKYNKSLNNKNFIKRCDSIQKIEKQYQLEKDFNPTSFYKFCSKYDFSSGSTHSIIFLKSYINSQSRSFVLSQYKYIIQRKWNKYFLYFFFIFLLNVLHTIFFSYFIYSAFDREINSNMIVILDGIVLTLMLINELLTFISLGKHYLLDYLNYFDILCIVYSVLVMILYKLDRQYATQYDKRLFYFGGWFGVVKIEHFYIQEYLIYLDIQQI